MSTVFISYRREDSAPWAGRICDRLSAAFGSENVFMDVQDIAPGSDFAEAIERKVSSCDVVLAVIGPRWLESLTKRGGNRDLVEHEIAAALKRGVRLIPVLVGNATMPNEADLPPDLATLARRQAIVVRDSGFDQDVAALRQAIGEKQEPRRSTTRVVATVVIVGIVIAVVGSAVLLLESRRESALDGLWVARMQRPGQRPYNLRLRLQVSGSTLNGEVVYPTGTAGIQGGTYQRGDLAFFTKHIPQFETEPATILFSGKVEGREIHLTATAQDGLQTRGIARKTE